MTDALPAEVGIQQTGDRLPAITAVQNFLETFSDENRAEASAVLSKCKYVVDALDVFRKIPHAHTVLSGNQITDGQAYGRLSFNQNQKSEFEALKQGLEALNIACKALAHLMGVRGRKNNQAIIDYFNETLGCSFAVMSDVISVNEDSAVNVGYDSIVKFMNLLSKGSAIAKDWPNLKPLYFALKVEELCSDQSKLEEFIAKF